MAGVIISDHEELAEEAALADLFILTDVSDTTQAATGTTKKNTGQYVLGTGFNNQTGAAYTVLVTDLKKLVSLSNAGAVAVTVPQAVGSFGAGWWCLVQNRGAGAATLTPTTSTIDGAASMVLNSGEGTLLVSNGADWFTFRGKAVVSGVAIDLTKSISFSGVISPAVITADQDDYNPAGLVDASVLRLDSDAAWDITSLAGGAAGRLMIVHYIGAFSVTFKDAAGTGTAANRFYMNGDLTLSIDESAVFQYDGTSGRWRHIGGSRPLGLPPSGAASGDLAGTYPSPTVKTNLKTTTLTFVIDGGGAAIAAGIAGDLGPLDFACTIQAATLLADQPGDIVVDIWKDTYANYPPTDTESITAAAPPTLSTADKSQDTSLTGWDPDIAAGDTLRFNVDSAATVERVTVSLKVVLA